MSTTPLHWKNQIDDLRGLAQSVRTAPAPQGQTMSARTAAACLSGIIGLVSRKWSVDVMQQTCAEVVRCRDAWATSFGLLPAGYDGRVTESTQLIAVVARSLLPLAGAEAVRDALAFWASEDDPAIWQAVAA